MRLNPDGEVPDVGIPRRLAASMTIGEQQEWLRGFLHRHPVSRRTALKGGASVLVALGATTAPWALAGCARAASTPVGVIGRHLSFGSDPRTQMAIAAELTGRPVGRVVLDVGADTTYGQTVEAEVRQLVSMVPQQDGSIRGADQFFVHGVAGGLAPGATLHYRFRLADGTTTPDAAFTTAPGRAALPPFTFTAFADQGVNNVYAPDDTRRSAAPSDALVALVAAQRPAFHLLAGDICYAEPSGNGRPVRNNGATTAENGFDNFDPTVWSQYFGVIEKSAAVTPWLFATGNHDMEALYDDNRAPGGAAHGYAGHAARLDLPRTGPSGCPSVYSVVYGNVGVLSLDANDLSTEIPTNAGYSRGAQLSWLAERLTALRADPAIDFVVAFFHHCAYATGAAHASDAGVRAALAPLFDRFAVDLVVQGHNHQYERTDPIRGGAASRHAPDGASVEAARDGTTYICCGSGGRPRYSWPPGETDSYRGVETPAEPVTGYVAGANGARSPETVLWSRTRYLDYAFLAIHVAPAPAGGTATMSVRAVTDNGTEIDRVDLVRGPRIPTATPTAWTRHRGGLSVPGHVG